MIDLAPLLNVVVPLAAAPVAAAATWALAKVAQHFHIQIQDSQRQALNDAIYHGLNYAARSIEPAQVKVRSGEIASAAVNYAIAHVPSTLNALGVTPDNLRQMVEARLASRTSTLNIPPF